MQAGDPGHCFPARRSGIHSYGHHRQLRGCAAGCDGRVRVWSGQACNAFLLKEAKPQPLTMEQVGDPGNCFPAGRSGIRSHGHHQQLRLLL